MLNKRRRGYLTASQHRERAQRYRKRASELVDFNSQRELKLAANRHDALADELTLVEAARARRHG